MADMNYSLTTFTSNMDILPTSEGWVSTSTGMTINSGILTYYAVAGSEAGASYYTLMADTTKTKIIEARVSMDSNNTGEFRLSINDGTRDTFLIFNGLDKTQAIAYYNRSSVYVNIGTGIDFGGWHTYRVELDSINGLKIYMDDIQVGSSVSYSLLRDTVNKTFTFSSRAGTVYYDWVTITDPTNIYINTTMADMSQWKYKKQITIPNTSIDADLTNFPLSVYLDDTNFDFKKTRIDGSDIKFTDLSNNELKFERKDQGISYTPYTNMILNPGFESGGTFWLGMSTAITVSTTAPYTGVNCVKNLNGTIWATAYQEPEGVAGHIYYASLAYKVITNNSTAFATIVCMDSIKTQLAQENMYELINATQPTWKKGSAILTAPANTAYVQFVANDYNASDGQIESYADDCVLIDLTELYGVGNEPTQAWCDANIDVANIRFVNSGKMKDRAVFNVQVPTITDATDTSIYMYYGKNTLTAKTYTTSTATYTDKASWDAIFTGTTDTREWQVPAQGIYWKQLTDTVPPNALLPPEPTLQMDARYNGWSAEGYIYIPFTGTYSFCINSDDGGEIKIDGSIISSCYSPRGAKVSYELAVSATAPTNTVVVPVFLMTGWHTFIGKMTNGVGGYGIGIGWKKPGDALYSTIPGSYFDNNQKIYTENNNYNTSMEAWQDQTGKTLTYNGNAKLQGGYSYGNDYINLLTNPWFNNGLDTWGSGGFTPSISNEIVTFTATGQWNNLGSLNSITVNVGDVVYYGGKILTTTADTRVGLGLNSTGGSVFTTTQSAYGTGNFELTSGRYTATTGYNAFYFAFYDVLASAWQPISVKECFVINLTQWFGMGNEPTKEWCDTNINNKPKRSLNLVGASYTNLILNNGFESGATSWNISGTGASIVTTNPHSGTQSMQTVATTTPGGYYHQGVTLTINNIYYFSAWGKNNSNQTVHCDVPNNTSVISFYPNSTYIQKSSRFNCTTAGVQNVAVGWNAGVSNGAGAWIDDIILCNLTAQFGAGNEPTQAWCDANIGVSPSYLTVADNEDFNLGVNDFCIEGIFQYTKTQIQAHCLACQRTASGVSHSWQIHYFDSTGGAPNTLGLTYTIDGVTPIAWNIPFTLPINTLCHIAFVRFGTTLYAYINGVQNAVTSTIGGNALFNSTASLYIGQLPSGQYLLGNIYGLRITKGNSRYTTNFTSPKSFNIDSPQVVFCTNFDTIYDSNYAMIQHMGASLVDATGNGNNGTATGTTLIDTIYGKARSFNGSSDRITIPDSPTFDVTSFTMTAFVNIDTFPTFTGIQVSALFNRQAADGVNGFYSLALQEQTIATAVVTSSATYNPIDTTLLNIATPYCFTGKWSGTTIGVYKDGISVGTPLATTGTLASSSDVFHIGYRDTTNYQYYFDGNFNEARISNIARSDAWIKAESLGLKNTLVIYGVEKLNINNAFWFGLNF